MFPRVLASARRARGTRALHQQRGASFAPGVSRPGVNVEANWEMCAVGVAPQGEAFANLRTYPAGAGLSAGPAAPVTQGGVTQSWGAWEAAYDGAVAQLEGAAEVYLHDGAVGSSAACDLRVRVVSDRPEVAAFAKAMLHPVPPRSFAAAPTEVAVLVGADGSGPAGASFILEDSRATVLLTGDVTAESFREAVEAAAGAVYAQQGSEALLLRSCRALHAGSGSALVFGASPASLGAGLASGVVYGAHSAVWTAEGLSAFWKGACAPGQKGDLPPGALAVGGELVARPLAPDNAVAHPGRAVFVGAAKGAIKDVAAAAAPHADGEAFAAKVEAHQTQCVGVGSDGEVMKALSA